MGAWEWWEANQSMQMDSSRTVTSRDVARAAGVSRTTVSYVLNGRADLPEATRQRVLDAVDQLGYVPSGPARALRRGASELVVLSLPRWTVGHAIGLMLHHLTEQIEAMGLSLLVTQAVPGDAKVWSATAPLALLSFDPVEGEVATTMRRAGCKHFIVAPRQFEGPTGVNTMGSVSGAIPTKYLIDAGHQRLGYAGSNERSVDWYSDVRRNGVEVELKKAGLSQALSQAVGTDPDAALAAVQEWRAQGVTGIVCYNDDVALAVCAALRRLHLKCPQDLAVVGIDNTPAGACANPSLTSLDLNPEVSAFEFSIALAHALGDTSREIPDVTKSLRIVVRESA